MSPYASCVLAVFYVLVTAAHMIAWVLLSSRFPRLGTLANGAGVIFVIASPPFQTLGFGWTVLVFIALGFGLFAAVGGLIERLVRR